MESRRDAWFSLTRSLRVFLPWLSPVSVLVSGDGGVGGAGAMAAG